MRAIEPGHLYAMANVDGDGEQRVQFVRRRDDRAELLAAFTPGVLSQELLRVLIDRVRYLNDEDPCVEDVEIVGKLRDCLRLFESRAARRTCSAHTENVIACHMRSGDDGRLDRRRPSRASTASRL